MRKEKYHIYLSDEELKRVVVYLINLKNQLIQSKQSVKQQLKQFQAEGKTDRNKQRKIDR